MGLPLLIPLALAAANTPDRLSRSVASFMDWFSLLFFGLATFAAWFYWSVALAGVPEAAANSVARQVPGYVFTFAIIPFVIAISFTLLWAYAVLRARTATTAAHSSTGRRVSHWFGWW